MRRFTPTPAMLTWLNWAETFLGPGYSSYIGVRGVRLNPPTFPPEPPESDRELHALYVNILVPMRDAVDRFNANQNALEVAADTFAQMWFQQQSSSAP